MGECQAMWLNFDTFRLMFGRRISGKEGQTSEREAEQRKGLLIVEVARMKAIGNPTEGSVHCSARKGSTPSNKYKRRYLGQQIQI